MMKPAKPESYGVRGVVLSLLFVVMLLIATSVALNRISLSGYHLGVSNSVDDVFSSSSVGKSSPSPTSNIKTTYTECATGSFENFSKADDSFTSLVTSPPPSMSDDDSSTQRNSATYADHVVDQKHVPLNRSVALQQRVFQPASLPHYSFVKFSAYRFSLRTLFVTGITSEVARSYDHGKIAHTCEWHESDSKKIIVTEARMIFVKHDENSGTYSPTVIDCTFGEEVGGDGRGGLLVLRISTGYDRWAANLPVVAMEEKPGDADVVMHPPQQFPYKYAFCGPPMHGSMSGEWVLQWMTYHNYIWEGQAHFFFYNLGGFSDQDRPLFEDFLDAGAMTITDILDPMLTVDYPTWYFHQVLFINDCLHRSRFVAEHVFFFDFDEFLQVPTPNSLSNLLKEYKDAPWITLGNIYADTKDCRSASNASDTQLERMLWRWSEPECRNRKPNEDPWVCKGPLGRRKYVVNPQKTMAAGVHFPTIPSEGIHLSAKQARMVHYRGAPKFGTRLCTSIVEVGTHSAQKLLKSGLVKDETISKIFAKAKNFPAKLPSGKANDVGL